MALVQNIGYKSVFWSFAYKGWQVDNQPAPKDALKNIIEHLHSGGIYLFHAISETNARIMGNFIDQTRLDGYKFAYYK